MVHRGRHPTIKAVSKAGDEFSIETMPQIAAPNSRGGLKAPGTPIPHNPPERSGAHQTTRVSGQSCRFGTGSCAQSPVRSVVDFHAGHGSWLLTGVIMRSLMSIPPKPINHCFTCPAVRRRCRQKIRPRKQRTTAATASPAQTRPVIE